MARPTNPNSQRQLIARHGRAEGMRIWQQQQRATQFEMEQQQMLLEREALEREREALERERDAINNKTNNATPAQTPSNSPAQTIDNQAIANELDYETPNEKVTELQFETLELEELLNEDTEEKSITYESNPPNPADFDNDNLTSEIGATITQHADPPAQQEEAVKVGMKPDFMAGLLVGGIDWINTFGAPLLHERAAFTPGERAPMKQLVRALDNRKLKELDDTELELIQIFEECEKFREAAPLTEEEKENLRAPLEKMLEGVSVATKPIVAFLFAVVLICASRAVPIWLATTARNARSSAAKAQAENLENEQELEL